MEAELHGQFTLGPGDVPSPPGFLADSIASWTLRHHPALPVRRITDDDDAPIGWLLGHAFDAGGPAARTVRAGDATTADAIARAHWGRFVVVLAGGEAPELALDALGSLAVVYDPVRERAGSTISVLDPRTPARERELAPFTFHPAPVTGDPALRRLLPHHVLDLAGWRALRRGPALRHAGLDLETRAARIADGLERALACLADRAPLTLALSSGSDSRLLLACARPVWERVELVTFDYRERRSDFVDTAIARRIARSLGIPHRVLPVAPASGAERERYGFRIGYAGNPGKARDFDAACRRHLDLGRALVTGLGIDIGKSLYWERKRRGGERGRSPEDLLHLLRLYPERYPDASWRKAVEGWSAPLSHLSLEALYDLLLLEQKNACWAMPHLYGFAPFALNVLPGCGDELVDLMLSAPLEQKLETRLQRAVIRRACPALDAIPYGEFDLPGLWRYRLRRLIRRAAPARRRGAW